MSQYSSEWLERIRQKDSIIDNNVDGGLHQLVRDLAGELLGFRQIYRMVLKDYGDRTAMEIAAEKARTAR